VVGEREGLVTTSPRLKQPKQSYQHAQKAELQAEFSEKYGFTLSSHILERFSENIFYFINYIIVRAIKICLKDTYSKICVGKILSAIFPIQNGLK
jgi:hypothetical protein